MNKLNVNAANFVPENKKIATNEELHLNKSTGQLVFIDTSRIKNAPKSLSKVI